MATHNRIESETASTVGRPVPSCNYLSVVLLASALLMAGHFVWYDDTPFGVWPTLDGGENLQLARALASGTRLTEPFYRAPLFPALLAVFLNLGLPDTLLPWAARLLNAISVLAAAAAAGKLAERLWASRIAGIVAAALVGLNPVVIFFAADPYDILFATACFTCAVFLAVKHGVGRLKPVFAVSLLLGIGALARSHLLLSAMAWPILVGVYSKRVQTAFVACAGLFIALVGLGLANLAVAGEFRMTPWQGAYNFWAANGPNANGRFFAQRERINTDVDLDNPTKVESINLYGGLGPRTIVAMNQYWVQKTLHHIASHPLDWAALMLRKCFSLVHNHEQYDNKTYAFEKSLAPWLRWNPLGWGISMALAVAGTISLRLRPPLLFWFILIYAVGVLLFHTNNRFRVPMIPVLATLASGVVMWWRDRSKLAVAVVVAVLVFPPWFTVAGPDTTIHDHILLADAALHAGRDLEAKGWAERALRRQPNLPGPREIVLIADFNLFVAGQPLGRAETEVQLAKCLNVSSKTVRYIAGVYAWKLGRREEALTIWSGLAHQGALAALLLSDPGNTEARTRAEKIPPTEREPVLHLTLAGMNDAVSQRWLDQNLSIQAVETLRGSLTRLLAPLE